MKRCFDCMRILPDGETICPHCGFDQNKERPSAAIKPGTILKNRYFIGNMIGRGGFGITYIGWDQVLEHVVAVKEYFPSELCRRDDDSEKVMTFTMEAHPEEFRHGLESFMYEAKKIAFFRERPDIVNVYNVFIENNTAYIIMEYLDGNTLSQLLVKRQRMPYAEIRRILIEILEALSVVHEADMIHRDISPSNIFVLKNKHIKLIDFGSAKQDISKMTKSLSIVLKTGYAPIEQYQTRGRQGPWTDVYAVGALFYKMVTSKLPPESLERLYEDSLKAPSQLGIQIPPEDEKVMMKALMIRGEDRYASAKEMLEHLRAAERPKVNTVQEPGTRERQLPPPKSAQPPKVSAEPERKVRETRKQPAPIAPMSLETSPVKDTEVPEKRKRPVSKAAKKRRKVRDRNVLMIVAFVIGILLLIAGVFFVKNKLTSRADREEKQSVEEADEGQNKEETRIRETALETPAAVPAESTTPSPEPTVTPTPLPTAIGTLVLAEGRSAIYEEPDGRTKVLDLGDGTAVSVTDKREQDGESWAKVCYFGLEGWVRSDEDAFIHAVYDTIKTDRRVYLGGDSVTDSVAVYTSQNEPSGEVLKYGTEGVIDSVDGIYGLVSVEGKGNLRVSLADVHICGAGYYYVKTADSVCVRRNPGTDSEAVDYILPNQLVWVSEIVNGWGKIENGYAAMCFFAAADEDYEEGYVYGVEEAEPTQDQTQSSDTGENAGDSSDGGELSSGNENAGGSDASSGNEGALLDGLDPVDDMELEDDDISEEEWDAIEKEWEAVGNIDAF